MNRMINIVRELTRLFVDDGWIARMLLGVLVLAAIVSEAAPSLLATILVLLFGFIGIILTDVASSARY
jgi:hypothetical protein